MVVNPPPRPEVIKTWILRDESLTLFHHLYQPSLTYHYTNMKFTGFALAGFLGCAAALPQLGVPGRGPPAPSELPSRGPPSSSDLPTPVFSSGNPQRPTSVFDKRQLGEVPGRGPPGPGEVPGRGPPAPCEIPGRGPPHGKDDACPTSSATPSSSGFSSIPTVSVTPTPASSPVSSPASSTPASSSTPVSSSASLF